MKAWKSWLAVAGVAVAAFIAIRLGLSTSGLDRLFHEQIPVFTPGRSRVLLAVVAPFAVVLLASLLTSAVARSSVAVAYGASWLIYAVLLSQTLLAMSGAYLLLLPLLLPLNAVVGWLSPEKWHLPVHYSAAHEPTVVGLISVGLALIVVAIIELMRARRHHRLATAGLYASLRHPQHLGIIIWTLGFALWGASPIDLITWFVVSFVFVCLGMYEEGKLLADFGDEYSRYAQRVRFMPPLLPVPGTLRVVTGRQLGLAVGILVLGIAGIMALFYLVGVPAV